MKKYAKSLLTLGAMALFGFGIATNASADTVHTVKAGDTVSLLANQYQSSVNAIANANHLANANLIYVGQRLDIPTGNGNYAHTVTPQAQAPVTQAPVQKAVPNQTPVNRPMTPSTIAQPKQAFVGGGNGSAAQMAQLMQQKTGVSASTWAGLIQRESGGQAHAVNPTSGAYGYLQLLGHGEYQGMSMEAQANMAAKLYHQAGMSPWAM